MVGPLSVPAQVSVPSSGTPQVRRVLLTDSLMRSDVTPVAARETMMPPSIRDLAISSPQFAFGSSVCTSADRHAGLGIG
jgi:hypothetical protein